jgi:hypothetical protein
VSKAQALVVTQLRSYQLRCVRFLAAGEQLPEANVEEIAELGADLAALQEESERN